MANLTDLTEQSEIREAVPGTQGPQPRTRMVFDARWVRNDHEKNVDAVSYVLIDSGGRPVDSARPGRS